MLFILNFRSDPESEPESEPTRSPESESESEAEQPHHDSAPLVYSRACGNGVGFLGNRTHRVLVVGVTHLRLGAHFGRVFDIEWPSPVVLIVLC